MRKAISALLLLAIISSTGLPVFAQKLRVLPRIQSLPVETKEKTPVETKLPVPAEGTRFQGAEAFTDGTNVWLQWRMEIETQNFGFNVYAINQKGRRLVNGSIILGGATKIAKMPLYGGEYQLLTAVKGTSDTFVIETVPLSGKTVSSDAISPKYTPNLSSLAGASINGLLPKVKSGTGKIESSTLNPEVDLQAEVKQNLLDPDPDTQKWIAAQPGVKIGVRPQHTEIINSQPVIVLDREGLFRVTRSQLSAAGFDVTSDPTTWQLYTDGHEQAINVAANGDYVEFLGKAIDTIESDTRMYYLIAGPTQGRRIGIRQAGPGWSPVAARSYNQTFVKKERTLYVDSIINGDAENYWGNTISSSPYTLNFNLSGIDTTATNCTMSVKFQGFSFTSHDIGVILNGHVLGQAIGDGEVPFSGEYVIPVSFLNEGSNSLRMQATSGSDFNLFDQVDITYPRTYLATQKTLSFFTQNYRAAQLGGFTSANVRVFDTTEEGSPVQITNLAFQFNGSTFGTRIPANRGRIMYAVEDSGILAPASITANTPSALSTTGHNANLVIITYKDWAAQAENWADYRRGQGFSVEVVDVADIFDEFNYGVLSANSLRNFLQYAKNNWQTPPQYVLLLGDATVDPRNYEGVGFADYVPVKIITTLFSETGSDDSLVDFNDDGLAEIAIGRIPARNGQTVTNAMNKVINFEQPANQTLDHGALFAYDVDAVFDFGAMSGRLRDLLPAGTPSTMIGKTDTNAQQSLVTAINTGKYVVNYSGHGSVGVWASTSFFSGFNINSCSGQPTCINNPNQESIFVALTCLNGYFLTVFSESLSERLLKATNGGAVVVWASTGLTTPDIQEELGQRFYSQLGTSTTMTRMGDFVLDAKSTVIGGPDVRLSFALIGDPMLKIKQ